MSAPSASALPAPGRALPGRSQKMQVAETHVVSGNPTMAPFPVGLDSIMFGMGCFWGAERLFWRLPGVFSTQVGYAGGLTPNPNYEEVCTGMRQHADLGSQYRSVIFTSSAEQQQVALQSKEVYQQELLSRGLGSITTHISELTLFFYAEDHHQQYLKKTPKGTCPMKGTGVSCPLGPEAQDQSDGL
ncbi:unnamed protein product [Knipowitschia caucasica]